MTLPTHRQSAPRPQLHFRRSTGVIVLGLLAGSLHAQEYWTNLTTGSHTLSTPANWEDANALTAAATDVRFFVNSGGTDLTLGGAYTINNDLIGLSLNRLDLDGNSLAAGRSVAITGNTIGMAAGATLNLLNSASSGGNAFNYTLDALSFAGNLTMAGAPSNGGSVTVNNATLPGTAAAIVQNGSGRLILNNTTLSADHTFSGSGSGTFTLGGTLTLAGSRIVDVSGAIPVQFGGTITDGAASYSITKTGSGTLALAGANHTFDGGVAVNNGTLALLLGAGNQNHSPGGISVQNGAAVRIDWGGTPGNPVGQSNISVGVGGASFEYGAASGNPITAGYSGNFSGSTALRLVGKNNKDFVSISGDNKDYSGAVTIESGTPFSASQNTGVFFANANARFGSASSAILGVKYGGRVGFTSAITSSDLAPYSFGPQGGIVLSGASGSLDASLSNPFSLLAKGGGIHLDNRNNVNNNRWDNGASVALNDQVLQITGRNANDSPVSESVGAMTASGGSQLILNRTNGDSTAPGSGITLTASSLAAPGAGSSLLIQTGTANDFGDPAGAGVNALVVTGSKPSVVNGMVSPAIQQYTGSNSQGTFLTFSGNNLVSATYVSGFDSLSSTEIANVSSSPTLSANETVHALRVSSGSLAVNAGVTLGIGSGGLILSSTTVSGTGTIDFGTTPAVLGVYNAAAQASIAPKVTGSAGLTVLGASQTLSFTNNGNTFTGGVFLNGGATRFAGTSANGNDVHVNTFGRLVVGTTNSAATDTIGGLTGTGTVSSWIANAGTAVGTLALAAPSGTHTFDGRLIDGNSATVRPLSVTKSGGSTQVFTYDNTYTGVTTINGGVLSIPSIANAGLASPLGASTSAASNLVLGGGTLRYTGLSGTTDRGFTLTSATSSSIDVSNASGTLTLNGSSASTSGNLVKTGSGTLVLNGNNAHTGFTRVGAGTLRLISGGAILDTAPLDFAAAANNPTLDLAGFNRSLGQITNSGVGANARIDNTTPVPVTLSVGTVFGTNSTFDGQIGQSGGGAVSLRVGQSALVPASTLNLGGTGGSTFTGKVQVQPNATLIVSSGQESSLGLAAGTDAIYLNGGTLRVETQDLTINDTGRDVLVDLGNVGAGLTGGTFSVAPGRLLTIANTVDASGIGLRKADAGTLNLTGQTRAGTFTLLGGVTDIDGGDLRVNALNLSGGTFNWGSGRLSLLNRNGADGSTDYSSTIDPAGPEVRVGRALTVTGDLATDNGSVLELHGSPTFYENANIRFNQLVLSGLLDLTAVGDTLEVEINTTLLRGDTLIEYGSIPLVVAGQINGMFDAFGTVTSGGTFDQHTGAFTTAAALPDDTWYLQYADTADVDSLPDTLFFHYRLTPTFIEGGWAGVPEPGTFSLLGAGALALRALRRRDWRGGQSTVPAPGPRRSRSRRTALRARVSKSW